LGQLVVASKPERPAAPAAGLLTREQILAAQDIRSEPVEVPEWGGTVMVRGLTGRSRDALELRFAGSNGNLDKERGSDFRAAFAAMSIVDAAGERMFTDDDVKALGEKSSLALQRVFDAAIRLSAADPSDIDGIVEDLKADPSGVTGSD
jgi:hypothetical protein